MIRYDKLTVKAQEALQQAQEIAARSSQQQIEPVHLLAALLAQSDGIVAPLRAKLGVSAETVDTEVRRIDVNLPDGLRELNER